MWNPFKSSRPEVSYGDKMPAEVSSQDYSFNSHQEYTPPEDKRTNFCPNCGTELKKVPGAKTKCPHCGKYMYVRTHPVENARILVSEDDLEGIDDIISQHNGTWEERLRKKTFANEFRENWISKHGVAPNEDDVLWNVLNREGIFQAQAGEWGLWRNNEYALASAAQKRGFYDVGFLHFCIVAVSDYQHYLDLNGDTKELVSSGFLAPGKGESSVCAEKGALDESKQEELFKKAFEVFQKTGQGRGLHLTEVKKAFDRTK